jgi:hypothetical protein
MRARWDKAGKVDWISRYYPKGEPGEPQPAPDGDWEDKPPVKHDIHERNDEEDADEEDDAPRDSPLLWVP